MSASGSVGEMMGTVDVVVPCYRYGKYLEQCVRSVLDQDGVSTRVLILDDASPDDTPEVGRRLARDDARVTYVRHAANQGHIRTYNNGIEWASSDYFLLLSADDYLLPGALGRAVALLNAHQDLAFAFGNAVVAYADGSTGEQKALASRTRILDATEFLLASHARNIVPTPTVVVRTSLQKACGGYKPELPHAGDMEMWFRLAARGKVCFIDAHQAVYRRHDANMSLAYSGDSMLPDIQQRLTVLQTFFTENSMRLADADRSRRGCLQWLAHDALVYAHDAFNHGNKSTAEQLAATACVIHPEIKWTPLWWKLSVKRIVGPRAWQAVSGIARGRA